MEAELFLNSPVAGRKVKVLINRHCTKGLVFYSVDIKEQGTTTTTECYYMTYDKDEWKYKFVTSPSRNSWIKQEEEFSEIIFERFHTHCQN